MLNLNNERTLKIDDEKRKINNTMNNATDRYMERNSMLDRNPVDKNNDRNDKKEMFKKQFQEKFILATSPAVEKEFMCDEELDIKPIEKKPTMYDKKLSEKKLSIPLISQNPQVNQQISTTNPTQMSANPSNALINQQRYVKKIDRKTGEK